MKRGPWFGSLVMHLRLLFVSAGLAFVTLGACSFDDSSGGSQPAPNEDGGPQDATIGSEAGPDASADGGPADGPADALADAAADQETGVGDAGSEAGATADATIAEGGWDAATVTDAGADDTALLDAGDAGDAAACVGATDTGLVQNGDFCEGLAGWSQVDEDAGSFSGYPHFVISAAPWCNAEAAGDPAVYVDVPGGAAGAIEQQITLPNDGGPTLSLTVWGNLDPVTVTISLVDGAGEHVLDMFTPPAVQSGGGASCTGSSPIEKAYSLSAYQGTVTLRFGATSNGVNGAIANFDNIVVQ